MILDLAGNGPLGAAVRTALEQAGETVRTAPPTDADLFTKAWGCRAIVYAPAPDILQGQLAPAPDVARMRAILGATNAPGVRALVVVVPRGYDDELDALARYGIPYVVLRAAPLLEELAQSPALEGTPPVWLPRGSSIRVASGMTIAAEVVRAIDEATGARLDAPSEVIDAAEALRRAAKLIGRDVIRTTAPRVDGVFRRVGKVLGLRPPPVVMFHERLAQAAAAPASA